MMERPELDRLRDDAQGGKFDAVLINDVDRLARDVAHLGVIKRDLERKGIKVIFRKLPTDTSPTSNLMVNILGSFAEFERELISDRTRRGRRYKVEVRKQYLGSNSSYGFRYTPKDRLAGKEGILDLIPDEAEVVRQMFEWVDQEGLSSRRVLLRLNERQIRPRKGAPTWGRSSVLRILRNEMYAGVWHYNKHQLCEPLNPASTQQYRRHVKSSNRLRSKTEWLPLELPEALRIVPKDRWNRVQDRLTRNITFSPRNEKHTYLLKALVRCGACGARYVGDPCHGKFYYRCCERCKKLPSVNAARLDACVKAAATELMLKPEIFLEPLQNFQKADARERKQKPINADAVEQAAARLAKEEDRILEAYRTGLISPLQLGEQLEKLKAKRSAVDLQQIELQRQQETPPEEIKKAVAEYCAEAATNLEKLDDGQWREFLQTIIQTIIYHGDRITIQARVQIEGTHVKSEAEVQLQPPR